MISEGGGDRTRDLFVILLGHYHNTTAAALAMQRGPLLMTTRRRKASPHTQRRRADGFSDDHQAGDQRQACGNKWGFHSRICKELRCAAAGASSPSSSGSGMATEARTRDEAGLARESGRELRGYGCGCPCWNSGAAEMKQESRGFPSKELLQKFVGARGTRWRGECDGVYEELAMRERPGMGELLTHCLLDTRMMPKASRIDGRDLPTSGVLGAEKIRSGS